MSPGPEPRIGVIGLGAMGQPMALRLQAAFGPIHVWNRSAERCAPLVAAGAMACDDPDALFAACDVVLVMLADEAAMDAVLAPEAATFAARVRGRTIINAATISGPASQRWEQRIREAGGAYVEAPVSGSRVPAESGQLLAMLAGAPEAVAAARPVMAPMCRQVVDCGPVPSALTMKFAVNLFLIASVTGLAESAHFARAAGIDLRVWADLVDASQMASDISRVKTGKLREGDLSPQAAINNVLATNLRIVEAAHASGIPVPLAEATLRLYARAAEGGLGALDMISVVDAFPPVTRPDAPRD
ncbi:NAD(P)-dependent oxidoreductase [Silanimonas algicola]